MKNKHEELKCAMGNSRQAFSDYKVSTFFSFDSEFLKTYGDAMAKVSLLNFSILGMGYLI